MWSLDAKEAENLTVADLEAASLKGVESLYLVQALANSSFQQAKLWLVTRNTQLVCDANANLSRGGSSTIMGAW